MAKKIIRKKKKKKKGKKRLSPQEKKRRSIKRKFKTNINTVFNNGGFTQIPTRGHNLDIHGQIIEVDSVFIHENIVVISEDTMTKRSTDIRDHLNNTAQKYSHIERFFGEFLQVLDENYDKFGEAKDTKYSNDDLRIVFIYCSYNKVDDRYKSRHKDIVFLDYAYLQYFLRLSRTISRSVRFEMFKFLGLGLQDIGLPSAGTDIKEYDGYLLPESPSGYPRGYKIVSFLIEPQGLLEQSYVLRKDSWRDSDCLYQRLLLRRKIKNMREYLVSEGRVFVNNIIVSLPEDTKLLDNNGRLVSKVDLTRKKAVKVKIQRALNTIGLIDGQHRLFAYHEGIDQLDETIKNLRVKQHLLLTGIIYPPGTSEPEKAKFEAQLFLEINDKQTSTRAHLKQAIELIINPFSVIAISKRILNNLATSGPLTGYLEEHFYDTKKIKTSSIVSFGLKHIVKLSGEDTFFRLFPCKNKQILLKGTGKNVLEQYIEYCTTKINDFLTGFWVNISDEMWTTDRKISRVLTTTTINGLIFCLRRLIENNQITNQKDYQEAFENMTVDFRPEIFGYKSSHWKDLGDQFYKDCFS